MNKKKLFIWADSPCVATGFGVVSKNLFRDLHNEYEVYILGINDRGTSTYDTSKYFIFPVDNQDILGLQKLAKILKNVSPDKIILFQDIFNTQHVLPIIKETHPKVPILAYFPIDGTPVNLYWRPGFDTPDKLVTYTKWGVDAIYDTFPHLKEKKIEYLYHGVDTTIFNLYPSAVRQRCKKEAGWDDRFLIVSNNRYQPRKALPLSLRAVALFTKGYKTCKCGNIYATSRRICDLNNCGEADVISITPGHSDVTIYMHAAMFEKIIGDGAASSLAAAAINAGFVSEDIPKHVAFFNGNPYENPYTDHRMAELYNIADVNISTTLGEGSLIEGTPILTTTGYKNIENIKENDLVFNDKQEYTEVHKTLRKKFTGDIYKIQLFKFPEPIILSQDHKLLTDKGYVRPDCLTLDNKVIFKKVKSPEVPPEFLDLSKYINTHYIIDTETIFSKRSGKTFKRFIPINKEVCKLFGLYVAEGSGNSGVQFSLHQDEIDLHDIISQFVINYLQFGNKTYLTPRFKQSKKDKSGNIYIGVLVLKELFSELFGTGAHNKKFPLWILGLSEECRQAFFDGLIAGDGYISERKHIIRLRTVSKQLAYLTRDLMVSLGMVPSVTLQDNSKGYGTKIYSIDFTGLNYQNGDSLKGQYIKQYEVNDTEIILNIKSIEKITIDTYGYDLEVPNGESYSIGQCMVHNCGLSLIEAAACGTTSIAPNNSAIPEMLGDTGYIVNNIAHITMSIDNNNVRPVVSVPGVVDALETEYQKWIANGRKKVINTAAIDRVATMFDWNEKRALLSDWLKAL